MTKGILGLNISSVHEVKYTYLIKVQKRLVLLKMGEVTVKDSLFDREAPVLGDAITGILTKEDISPSKLCLTLSGKEVFIHQINLPRMSDTELDEIIAEEVKKVPKFYNKEFDYIYSVFNLDKFRTRISFCAVPTDVLEACIEGAGRTGVYLESLEVSPLNLLELLYSKVAKDRTEALIILDSELSYTIIFSQNECKLLFKMTTRGADLHHLSGEYMHKPAFLTWIEEIKRVFKSYQREFGASPIEKIWLVWDSGKVNELDVFLTKELGIEVVKPALGDFEVEIDEALAQTGFSGNPVSLISLAGPLVYLRGLKQKFDFEHFLRKPKFKETVNKILLGVLIYILATGLVLGGLSLNYFFARKKVMAEEKEVDSRIASLEKKTAELKNEREDYLSIKERLFTQAAFVKALNKISWSEVIANVGLALPEDVSLSSFKVTEGGAVKLQGATLKIDSVSELIRKLSTVSFLTDIKFDFLKERELKEKEAQVDKYIEFGVVTRLVAKEDQRG